LSSAVSPELLAEFMQRVETMQANSIKIELILVAASPSVSLDPFVSCMFSNDFVSQFALEHPERRTTILFPFIIFSWPFALLKTFTCIRYLTSKMGFRVQNRRRRTVRSGEIRPRTKLACSSVCIRGT
jgi:hypothetical protein